MLRVVIVLVTVLGGLYLGLSMKDNSSEIRNEDSRANEKSNVLQGRILEAVASGGRSGADITSPSKPTFSNYYSDVDGRKFVLENWSNKSGGKFYSSRLVDNCVFVKHSIGLLGIAQPNPEDVASKDYLAAGVSLDRLKRRCAQFSDAELEFYSGAGIGPADDYLMALINSLQAARVSGDSLLRARALKEIFETADPLLLDQLGLSIFMIFNKADSSTHLYFGGHDFALTDNSALAAVPYLLPCQFGADCGLGDVQLLIACATGAGCYSSREEKVYAEYAGGSEEVFREIKQLTLEVVAAIKSKDYSGFDPRAAYPRPNFGDPATSLKVPR